MENVLHLCIILCYSLCHHHKAATTIIKGIHPPQWQEFLFLPLVFPTPFPPPKYYLGGLQPWPQTHFYVFRTLKMNLRATFLVVYVHCKMQMTLLFICQVKKIPQFRAGGRTPHTAVSINWFASTLSLMCGCGDVQGSSLAVPRLARLSCATRWPLYHQPFCANIQFRSTRY